jgi:hypothetical protein
MPREKSATLEESSVGDLSEVVLFRFDGRFVNFLAVISFDNNFLEAPVLNIDGDLLRDLVG